MFTILPRRARRSIKRLLASPAFTFLGAHHAGIGTCLNYHRITCEDFGPRTFNPNVGLSVHQDAFDEQMRFLSEHCVCLTAEDAVRLLIRGTLPVNSVVVTFDDGYRDNLTLALPILEKYGVPATIFVATGLIDRTANLWWEEHRFILERLPRLSCAWQGKSYDWDLSSLQLKEVAAADLRSLFKRLDIPDQQSLLNVLRAQCPEQYSYNDNILSWEEVRKLDEHPLITIGAHTRNHAILSRLTESELRSELAGSKKILEGHLNHSVDLLAYPVGLRDHASLREFAASRDAGFSAAFTTRASHLHFDHANHLHSLPRIVVDYFDNLESLRWKLSGFEAMIQQRGRAFVTD